MKAHLINRVCLVPRSRSSAKVKVEYQGYISQEMVVLGALVFHTHILFFKVLKYVYMEERVKGLLDTASEDNLDFFLKNSWRKNDNTWFRLHMVIISTLDHVEM